MSAPVFVDTNIFIYAVDRAHPEKQEAARRWLAELWKSRRGRTSFQVLQEFFAKVTKKWPDTRDSARAEVRDLLAWRPVSVDAAILELGWRIQDRYQISFWDALIVSAAQAADCRFLLTEDLQTDQDFDDVRVVNPFLHRPDSVL